jgi:hypothetical protein
VKLETEVSRLQHDLILVIMISKTKKAHPMELPFWRLTNGGLNNGGSQVETNG